MPRLPDLEAWGVFARLSETQSFSRTAADLGLATATVSKAISRLEARLGVSLLNRTSRRLALTDVGRAAALTAARLLAEAETMEAGAMARPTSPAGLVRMAVPMALGILHVASLVPDLLDEYPQITVDLHLDDEYVDVFDGKFDLVLRMGAVDEGLSLQRVCLIRRVLVAAPAYIERHGVPQHPDDLAAHHCLLYAPTPGPSRWRFIDATGSEMSIAPTGPLWASNGNALAASLLAGVGIAAQLEFLVADGLATGRLQPIMPGWTMPLTELHVVTPPGKYRPPSVNSTAAFLVERLRREAWAILAEP